MVRNCVRPTYTPILSYIYYLLRIVVLFRVLNRTDSRQEWFINHIHCWF